MSGRSTAIEGRLRGYIIPNVLAMTGTSCYVLADTFFIAWNQGADGITALNLALPLFGLIYAVGSMLGVGSATRYALYKALGDPEADNYLTNAILWVLLAGLAFIAAGLCLPRAILVWMGADETILAIGQPYVAIVLCFAPLFMLNHTCTAFVRNDGSPNIAMAATVVSGLFNIVFDYIFMFPMGLGMVGAALATGFSPVVSMLLCLFHFLSPRNTLRLVRLLPSPLRLLRACRLGVAAFVGEISSGVTTMVFNFILLGLGGNVAVAAYGVIANLAFVGMALFNGVSQGLQPLASEVHGKGDAPAEARIYRHALRIALAIAAALVGAVLLLADPLVAVFNSEGSQALADYAVPGIRLYFLGFLLAAVNLVRAGFYSATDHSLESSVIALSRGIFAIVFFAFLLSRLWGVTGVWLSFLASELFTFLLLFLVRTFSRKRT